MKYGLLLITVVFLLFCTVEPRAYSETKESGSYEMTSPDSVHNGYEENSVDHPSGKDTGIQPASDMKIVEDIREIEFHEIKYGQESPEYYGFIKGRIPVLISAPHGTRHFRRRWKHWKGEDEYTSSLAIELGRLTGAFVIYVKNKTREDPNNDPRSRYKTAVAKAVKEYHIKFLLDLHGSDEDRPYKIDIGILSGKTRKSSCPTFKKVITEAVSDFEPKLFNKRFCANDACTMTSFAKNELGIEAAQVEVNAKYRIVERKPDSSRARRGIEPHFKANPKDVLDLVTKLEQMVYEINLKIEEGNGVQPE